MSENPPSAEYLAESQATLLNVFFALPIPLEIFSTSLRLWVKLTKTSGRRLAFDDYLMICATIVGVTVCGLGLGYAAPHGLGRHIDAVPKQDVVLFRKGDYIFSHFYNLGIGLTKLAVLALYYRIFMTPKFSIVTKTTAVVVALWIVALEITLGFACRPIAAWWGAAEGDCLSKAGFTLFTNVSNLIFDLWIFLMPLRTILGLQGMKDRKLSLCLLFSVGLGTCAISAARLVWVFKVGVRDFTWKLVPLAILSVWEPCGGILCANLPVIYGLLRKAAKSVGDTLGRGLKSKSSGHKASSRSGSLSDGRLNHNWAQLNDSGAAIHSKVSADKPTEMNDLRDLGDNIMVQREVVTNSLYAPSSESIIPSSKGRSGGA